MIIFRMTAEAVLEPCPIDDVFCTAAVRIERLGPRHRLVFATPSSAYEEPRMNKHDLHVLAKLVLTDDALHALLRAIPQYLHVRAAPSAPATSEARLN
jgi:hypothetical protein